VTEGVDNFGADDDLAGCVFAFYPKKECDSFPSGNYRIQKTFVFTSIRI